MFIDTEKLNHRVTETLRPRRIVSLVPSQTELLAGLGLDDEVVGLTRFCVHPAGWKARKQIVGGTKSVRLDRVAALATDLDTGRFGRRWIRDPDARASTAPVRDRDPLARDAEDLLPATELDVVLLAVPDLKTVVVEPENVGEPSVAARPANEDLLLTRRHVAQDRAESVAETGRYHKGDLVAA